MLVVVVLQCRAGVAARIRSHAEHPGWGGRARNRLAAIWHLVAIFYILALWLVWAAEVRHGYLRIWNLFLVTIGVLGAARLLSIMLLGLLERTLRVGDETRRSHPGIEPRANRYLPLLRQTINLGLTLVTMVALLQAWGVNALVWFRTNALGGRLVSTGVTILIAGALALAVWEVANAAMDSHLGRLTEQAQLTRSARLRTLRPILRTTLLTGLLVVFGLTALSEIGVNIAPLLAGAGILRRRHRLREPETGAGFHHRHLPADRERDAGGRLGDGLRACPAPWRTCRSARCACARATARCTSSLSVRSPPSPT